MATGGDLIEATCNHPTLGNSTLFFKAAEDGTFDLGGYFSSDDANMVDGGGNMIDQINRKRWKVSSAISWDMNSADELSKIAGLSASPVLGDWTFSHINGTVWGGKGKPVGDYEGNTNQATFTITIAGGGKLKKISG